MNIIQTLLSGHSYEIRTNARIIINTLTSQVISSLMSFCSQRNSQNADPEQYTGLDQRNEQDEYARGQKLRDQLTEEAGHDVRMEPYKIASICDGLRYSVYEDLATALGPDSPKAEDVLLHTNPHFAKSYDLPMSLESLLDFRVQRAGEVDEKKVKKLAESEDEDINFVREVARDQAARDQKRMEALAPDVMVEADSLNDVFDLDAFSALPVETQHRIVSKVYQKLFDENKRLFGLMLRGLSVVKIDKDEVPIATLRRYIKHNLALCEDFMAADKS